MKEKRIEVRTYVVRLMCDKCDGGEMLPTGVSLPSNPPQFPHKCNKCGYEGAPCIGRRYPRLEHEDVV